MRHWSQRKRITKVCLVARQIKSWQLKGTLQVEVTTGRRPVWAACWHAADVKWRACLGDIIPTVWNSEAMTWPRCSEAAASLNWIKSHRGLYFTPKREILLLGYLLDAVFWLESRRAGLGKSLFIQHGWMSQNKQLDMPGRPERTDEAFHKPRGGSRWLGKVWCWESKIWEIVEIAASFPVFNEDQGSWI